MCCFCLKLLDLYEIGITPNFKFEFCNYTSLFVVILRSEQLLPNLRGKTGIKIKLCKTDMYTYTCAWTVTGSVTKLKTGNCRPKQRKQLRMLSTTETNNSMHDSMHASAVHTIFGPSQPVLSFVADRAQCTSVRLRINFMELSFHLFQ